MYPMYQGLVFVHVLGVFAFLLAHGASAAVAFKLRRERRRGCNPEHIRPLLELSQGTTAVMSGSLVVVLSTGMAAGFLGNWWGYYWIWAALGVFLLLSLAMTLVGRRAFERVRAAVGQEHRVKGSPTAEEFTEDELAAALTSVHPLLLTLMGGTGLAALLWLMMFKPFQGERCGPQPAHTHECTPMCFGEMQAIMRGQGVP